MSSPDRPVLSRDLAGTIVWTGAHESTVRTWIKSGELRASKFGSRISYRIRRSDYEAFLRRCELLGATTRRVLGAAPLE